MKTLTITISIIPKGKKIPNQAMGRFRVRAARFKK